MAMPDARAAHPPTLDIAKLLASRWLWCLVAVLFLAGRDLAQGFSDLLVSLGDTDDATRLYQVRHLMATGAWFDMTLPRLGGDTPLVSHWSRLIDLPLKNYAMHETLKALEPFKDQMMILMTNASAIQTKPAGRR